MSSTTIAEPPTRPEETDELTPTEEAARQTWERLEKSTVSPKWAAKPRGNVTRWIVKHVERVNKELWLLLSMFVMLGVMNYLAVGQHLVLGLYTLPTLFSAYSLGRRHAVLTAFASILLVALAALHKPELLGFENVLRWYDLAAWGGILLVTAYAMGTLHNWHRDRITELHETYRGLLIVLRQFISRDEYTENHCYRVSVYAARIGAEMGLSRDKLEDMRSAALLHDIGKLKISRALLHKASQLSNAEYEVMRTHVESAESMLAPVSGPLHRILPIILAHHERPDGKGYRGLTGASIPIEARVIAIADAYDAMTSDRPYRKAMSPTAAKENILSDEGAFDPDVVRAFERVHARGGLEIPNIMV
jgi:HD-GYP domain-containing protein (c-di-GMP phosphodiesterase class II)